MQTLRAALNTMSRTSAVARLMPSSSKTALRLCSLHQIQSYSTLQKRVRPQCLTLSSDMVRLRRPPRRFNSTKPPTDPPKPNPTTKLGSLEPAPSLSQRLKKLSREYGYTAAGVYLALVVLDFPFCFLAVQYLGMERIGHWEHVVLGSLKNIVRILFPGAFQQTVDRQAQVQADKVEEDAKEEQAGEASKFASSLGLTCY